MTAKVGNRRRLNRASSDVTVTDLFCGAGGSSQGARTAGFRVVIAANHWELAVESHAANFPDTAHDIANISQTDPRRYPTTTVLWASPECTNHSLAKGTKRPTLQASLFEEPLPDEAAMRSRATMWDVVRFAERHPYEYIVVENVVDVRDWTLWDGWWLSMKALGYEGKLVCLNSMHASSEAIRPAPQSRDRVYIVLWRVGNPVPDLEPRPIGYCPRCDEARETRQVWKNGMRPWGRYKSQYVYRCAACTTEVEPFTLPAASVIDWTKVGVRIGDRATPLADKTRMRIAAGLRKYARPLQVEAAGHTYDAATPSHVSYAKPDAYYRAWTVDEPLKTLHTSLTKALVVPLEGRDGKVVRPAEVPLRTQTARHQDGLAIPPTLVPTGGGWNQDAAPVTDPMRTRTTRESEGVCTPPFIAELRGGGSTHRPVTEPAATFTASGTHHGLVQPTPEASMMVRHFSSKGEGGEMCTPTLEPMRTLTTKGHQSLVSWQAQYAYDSGALSSLAATLPTQTTRAGDALISGDLPEVDECFFRMLEDTEIGLGMAFAADYKVMGNKRERVRQYGNAVTPPASEWVLTRIRAAIESM